MEIILQKLVLNATHFAQIVSAQIFNNATNVLQVILSNRMKIHVLQPVLMDFG